VKVAKSIDRARICVTAVFAAHALVFSSWVAHIPHVKSELRLSDGALGNALLGAPLGALVATALCIRLLPRWGSHILVPVTVAGYAASGPLLGLARSEPELFLALTSVGFFLGGLDVAMNVQAAAVERVAARPIMSRFHGMRSLAVLLGSLVGAVCVSAGVGLTAQLTVIGLIIIVLVRPIAGDLVREPAPTARQKAARPQPILEESDRRDSVSRRVRVVPMRRICIRLVRRYLNRVVGAGPTVAALSYVPFTAVMALTRLSAPRLYGRVSIRWLLPSLALFAAAGPVRNPGHRQSRSDPVGICRSRGGRGVIGARRDDRRILPDRRGNRDRCSSRHRLGGLSDRSTVDRASGPVGGVIRCADNRPDHDDARRDRDPLHQRV
jgi:MFS family permease